MIYLLLNFVCITFLSLLSEWHLLDWPLSRSGWEESSVCVCMHACDYCAFVHPAKSHMLRNKHWYYGKSKCLAFVCSRCWHKRWGWMRAGPDPSRLLSPSIITRAGRCMCFPMASLIQKSHQRRNSTWWNCGRGARSSSAAGLLETELETWCFWSERLQRTIILTS